VTIPDAVTVCGIAAGIHTARRVGTTQVATAVLHYLLAGLLTQTTALELLRS
jgi:hypothetical protein